MEESDADTKARKRRRRSIRNLRRQSGIVPFSLGEEPSSDEQSQAISEYHIALTHCILGNFSCFYVVC